MIREEIAEMAAHAVGWLTRRQLLARTVTIKVRYSDFTTMTRSHTARPDARRAGDIVARAVHCSTRTDAGRRPVRLLGVSVHNSVRTRTPTGSPETGCRLDGRLID